MFNAKLELGVLGQLPNIRRCGFSGLRQSCKLCMYIHTYIHRDNIYYTPLPLNLANNKQATSNKQASNKQQATLLLSVLAITPFHRFGLYSTLAISYPRWCPGQIQVLSQKLTVGAPGQGRQVGRCPPKLAHIVPQNSLFWPKIAPKPTQNGLTKGNSCYTTRAPRWPRDKEHFAAL